MFGQVGPLHRYANWRESWVEVGFDEGGIWVGVSPSLGGCWVALWWVLGQTSVGSELN